MYVENLYFLCQINSKNPNTAALSINDMKVTLMFNNPGHLSTPPHSLHPSPLNNLNLKPKSYITNGAGICIYYTLEDGYELWYYSR